MVQDEGGVSVSGDKDEIGETSGSEIGVTTFRGFGAEDTSSDDDAICDDSESCAEIESFLSVTMMTAMTLTSWQKERLTFLQIEWVPSPF